MELLELVKAAFIGIVEGITEWLPISSTGHMILFNEFVHLNVSEAFWNMFLVVIQLGAILAVCVIYFKKLNPFASSKSYEERRSTWNLWGKIVVGCVPAAIVGLAFDDFMEEHFYNAYVVAAALIVYGIAFIVIERWRAQHIKTNILSQSVSRPRGAHFASSLNQGTNNDQGFDVCDSDFGEISSVEDMSYKTALGIGCFQVLSLVPGTSRSGSTIIGGLLLGTTRSCAAEYTFFLAIPVMFGASLLKLVKFIVKGGTITTMELAIMLVGMLVAFVVSLAAIKWLIGFVRKHDFQPFGVYRIILGMAVLIYFMFLV